MKKNIIFLLIFTSSISLAQIEKVLIPFKSGNHWGYSNCNGKKIIQPVYDSVTLFQKMQLNNRSIEYAKVWKEHKISFIDVNATKLIQSEYLHILNEDDDTNRFILINNDKKVGMIDFSKTIIPFEYKNIVPLRRYFYLVEKEDKLGILDFEGKTLIPTAYDQINYVSETPSKITWKVINDVETKFIETLNINDSDEIYMIPKIASPFEDENDNSQKKIDSLKLLYDNVIKVRQSQFAYILSKNGKYGFTNLKTKNQFKPEYSELSILKRCIDEKSHEFYILIFEEDEKYGLLDEKGNVLLPAQFDRISNTVNCIILELNELIGFYFDETKVLIPPKYIGYLNIESINEGTNKFKIIGVYEKTKKDWFYIGQNGVIFNE